MTLSNVSLQQYTGEAGTGRSDERNIEGESDYLEELLGYRVLDMGVAVDC